MSSNDLCKACTLLEGLERGMANSVIVSALVGRRRAGIDHCDLLRDGSRAQEDGRDGSCTRQSTNNSSLPFASPSCIYPVTSPGKLTSQSQYSTLAINKYP